MPIIQRGLTLNDLPVTLYPSRTRYGFLCVVCLVFVAGGIWMARRGEWIGWLLTLFFLFGFVVLALSLKRDAAYLRLEDDGLTLCSLYRRKLIPWKAIAGFGTFRVRYSKMVGWNYTDEYKRAGTLRSVNRSLVGFEGGLPTTYGMKADELAGMLQELLVEYQRKHPERAGIEDLSFDRAE